MQPAEHEIETELSRIVAEYGLRESGRKFSLDRYNPFNESVLLDTQSLERTIVAMLKQCGLTRLTNIKILDVGCGTGAHLRRFIDYGAQPINLSGIDLLPNRIEQARRLNPAIDWRVGSAHDLPYPDACFDLVTIFVVFSSILSEPLQQRIANEMWRVRKPGGLIMCYDFRYSNPRNRAVKSFTSSDLRRLFNHPGAKLEWRRVTLAPPISRSLAPRSLWLADVLDRVKMLDTHMLAIVSDE